MLANFQHPPGAEARSFITSLDLSLDPDHSLLMPNGDHQPPD